MWSNYHVTWCEVCSSVIHRKCHLMLFPFFFTLQMWVVAAPSDLTQILALSIVSGCWCGFAGLRREQLVCVLRSALSTSLWDKRLPGFSWQDGHRSVSRVLLQGWLDLQSWGLRGCSWQCCRIPSGNTSGIEILFIPLSAINTLKQNATIGNGGRGLLSSLPCFLNCLWEIHSETHLIWEQCLV